MVDQMKCPKCGGEMEEGTIPFSPGNSLKWGTKMSIVKGIENKHEIVTYRCSSCGYLESYAK